MTRKERKILEEAGLIYPSVVTNADRIRSMSDGELADYLWSVKKYDRVYDKHISSWKKWLQSPVEVTK